MQRLPIRSGPLPGAMLLSLVLLLPSFGMAAPGPHALQAAAAGPVGERPPPLPGILEDPTPGPETTVYGYLPWWSDDLASMPWDDLTHLALFAAEAETDGSLTGTAAWADHELARELADLYDVKLHLAVTNFSRSELLELMGADSSRAALIDNLVEWVERTGADGVNIDFEGFPVERRDELVAFTVALDAAVDEVVLATPAVDWSGAWNYSELSRHADLFIMAYDYHWSGGDPGPVDPLYGGGIWGNRAIDWTVDDYLTWGADPARLILGLPLFGKVWPSDGNVPGTATGTASSIFWAEAQVDAATHGRLWDEGSQTPYWLNGNDQGWYGTVESLDARVVFGLDSGLAGIGFWALGYDDEDPALWEMLRVRLLEHTGKGTPPDDEPPDDEPPADGPPDTGPPSFSPEDLHADAGPHRIVSLGDQAVLDGSGSSAPEGVSLSYRWTQIAGPMMELGGGTNPSVAVVPLSPGTFSFSLMVAAEGVRSTPDVVRLIVVDPPPPPDDSGCRAALAPSLPRRALPGALLLFLFHVLRRRS